METLMFNVFNFFNKLKKTTVPLVLLCPTFPYFLTWSAHANTDLCYLYIIEHIEIAGEYITSKKQIWRI